jgi:hypothetical protein
VMFCWSFLLIALTGPGPWSLDALSGNRLQLPRLVRPALGELGRDLDAG